MTRRIACVFAHPDDDTYGVGGALALHADEDLEVTVVLATSGDAGRIADPSLATRETLGAVREAEDLASWTALGVEADVRFLRHLDGRLAEVSGTELVAQIRDVLLECRAQVVVTFGPEGVTGHEDHVVVGELASTAFDEARGVSSDDDAFARLLHTALPQGRLDRFNELLRERGLEPLDPTQPFMPRGVPDAAVGVRVDGSPVLARKLEALRCHKTQAELEDIPFDLWPEILSIESFVVARPQRQPGGPVLADVFEGLPGA